MSTLNASKKAPQADWHREDIKAAVRKAGWTFRKLSLANGLSTGTVKQALDRPYPKMEGIIAAVLQMDARDIWPSRYAKRNFTPVLPSSLQSSRPRSASTAAAIVES